MDGRSQRKLGLTCLHRAVVAYEGEKLLHERLSMHEVREEHWIVATPDYDVYLENYVTTTSGKCACWGTR